MLRLTSRARLAAVSAHRGTHVRVVAAVLGAVGAVLPAHDPPACLRALDASIAQHPANPTLYFRRGEVYLQIDAAPAALADFERVAALRSDYPRLDLARGRALVALGRHAEGLAAAARELARDSRCGEAVVVRARALSGQRAHADALEAWDQALALAGTAARPELHLERADAAVSAHAVREAIAGLDRAIGDLGPVVTLQERAVVLCEQAGDYLEGARRLDEIVTRVARPESWLAWKARLLERAGRPAAAAATRRAALHALETVPDARRRTPATRTLTASLTRALQRAPLVPPPLLPAPAVLDAARPAAPAPAAVGNVLVPRGTWWRYSDSGTDLGTAWRAVSFDDTRWSPGRAELGFGDKDEQCTVNGGSASSRTPTIYFRRSFTVSNPATFTLAHIDLLCDDGAVVYLNDVEIARTNLPAGTITFSTLANQELMIPEERTYTPIAFPCNLLVAGTNVLAVEVHQASATSDDLSFDLELVATQQLSVSRGPYLQQATPSTMIVRWRTDAPSPSAVWLGSTPGNVTLVHTEATARTEHEVRLTGLTPDTVYYYAVGAGTQQLAGPSVGHRFATAPPSGTPRAMRFWVLGDCGTGDAGARAVRDAYLTFTGNRPTDLVLLLGDNAYYSGTDEEYQRGLFDIYPSVLRTTCVWPTFGNHDAMSARSMTGTGPYYDAFTLPTRAECGGLRSGTEAYYAFDHGNVHFVCLDSEDSPRSPSEAMLTWLDADLRATTATWVVAFFHHPPYSKGSHDSDNAGDSGGRMRDMRENALPVLEQHGVDVVLTGHSHSYERSYLLDGHYGLSATLTPQMKRDRGDGRRGGDGSYAKPSAGPAAHEGAVYVVAGSAGSTGGGPLDHPANLVSLNELGSLVLDVDGTRLDATFLNDSGLVRDEFTIEKGVRRTLVRDEPAISVATGGTQQLTLDAGASRAGLSYLVAGSYGTTPGLLLNGVQVPLNADSWFTITLGYANSSFLQNTMGQLDGQGRAVASIVLPQLAPSLAGTELFHAFVVVENGVVVQASNAVKLRLAP